MATMVLYVAIFAVFTLTASGMPSYPALQRQQQQQDKKEIDGGQRSQPMPTKQQLCDALQQKFKLVQEGRAPVGLLISTTRILERTRSRFVDSLTLARAVLSHNRNERNIRALFRRVAASLGMELREQCGVQVPEDIKEKVVGVAEVVLTLNPALTADENDKADDVPKKFPINIQRRLDYGG